jgi:hypothetical protein
VSNFLVQYCTGQPKLFLLFFSYGHWTLLRFFKTWITLQFQASTFLFKPIECWSCGVSLDRLSCLPPTRFRAFTTF